MHARARVLAIAPVLLTAACFTINVYFPEAAIQDLSNKIEDQVAKEAAAKAAAAPPATNPPAEPADKPKQSSGVLDLLLGTTVAHAEEVAAPEATSPAIRKIIDSRAGRLADLNAFKARGVVGENNQGLVETRSLETLADLKARADVQRLVKAENADREELYKEVAAAKGVDLSQLPKIRETYAATLRERANPGDWIQGPDGSWKKK
jgi:uncharacterized protein YdbL (DUF1318 family)